FFSSRRRHTRLQGDWSSDVCSSDLKALGREEGATLFMTLLAAFQILLSRYSGQEDVVVGTTVANRTREETEGLVGFFLNTLALRSEERRVGKECRTG